jgi:hypothetical protein
MSKKLLYNTQDNSEKGIQPFPESPSNERANADSQLNSSIVEEGDRNISATDLFSLFTADVIRENLEFRR